MPEPTTVLVTEWTNVHMGVIARCPHTFAHRVYVSYFIVILKFKTLYFPVR